MVFVEKLKILIEITEALSKVSTKEEIFDFILASVRTIFGVDYVAILFPDEENGHLTIVKSCGYPEGRMDDVKVMIGEGVTGRVWKTGVPIMVKNVKKEKQYLAWDDKIKSEVAVPIKVNGKVAGVLSLESIHEKYFTRGDFQLLCLFAAEVSAFIHHFDIYSRIEQTTKNLETKVSQLLNLNEVARNIVSAISTKKILYNILLSMREVLPDADSFAFLVYDKKEDKLVVKSVIGHPGEMIDLVKLNPTQGITGRAFTTKMETIVNDVDIDPDYVKGGIDNVSSEMAIPLIVKGEALGVIDIMSNKKCAFSAVERDFLYTITSFASIAIGNAQLFDDNKMAYFETIRSLAEALDARDTYTKGHSERVTTYSVGIAHEMVLDKQDMEVIKYSAILHDIGKIGVLDHILNKKTFLDDEEFGQIKGHPGFGEKILMPVTFLKDVRLIVKHHHEKYDGTGYPDGLKGNEIPLLSRIISVADAFDAMTSSRPYRKRMSYDKAVAELILNKGSQFDPSIVDMFLAYWSKYGKEKAESSERKDT